MAVAQAQYPVYEVTKLLRDRSIDVRFAIHPVAGRLPGHMNVLLAEARVPYDIVIEMEEINHDFPATDVAIVIGANDIVNPGALDDRRARSSACRFSKSGKPRRYRRPEARHGGGYAGVENPLFYEDNTQMLFGDARKTVEAVLEQLRQEILTKSA